MNLYNIKLILLFGLSIQAGGRDIVAAKNEALTQLFESRGRFHQFMCKLTQNSEMFKTETESNEPTVDMQALKNWIDENLEAFNSIAVFYHEQNKTEGMKNILNHILSPERRKELEETNPIVFKKNQALHELFNLKKDPKRFCRELSKSQRSFNRKNEEHKPTSCTTQLQEYIDKTPALFEEILKLCGETGKDGYMGNILPYILSPEMNEVLEKKLIVAKKNQALMVLCSTKFNFAQELERFKDLVRIENAEQQPTVNVSELIAKFDKNDLLFSEIGNDYHAKGRPEWMRNIFQHILSEARMKELEETNPIVFEKNMALIELCKGILCFKKPLPNLIVPRFKDLFSKENEECKPTSNTRELRDEFDENYVLFNEITNYYHQKGSPEWLKDMLQYMLSEARMKELLETNPIVFEKNMALIGLNELIFSFVEELPNGLVQELEKFADLFKTENEKHKPTYNMTKSKEEIDARAALFNTIAQAYCAKGKPEWMQNILRHILSKEKLMEFANIDKLFQSSGFDRFLLKQLEQKGMLAQEIKGFALNQN